MDSAHKNTSDNLPTWSMFSVIVGLGLSAAVASWHASAKANTHRSPGGSTPSITKAKVGKQQPVRARTNETTATASDHMFNLGWL